MDGIALKKRIPKGMVVKIWEQSIFLCSRDLKNLEVIFKSNDKKKKYQTVPDLDGIRKKVWMEVYLILK